MKNSLQKVKDGSYCILLIYLKYIIIFKKQKYTPSTFFHSHGGIETNYEDSEILSIRSNPSYDRRRIP